MGIPAVKDRVRAEDLEGPLARMRQGDREAMNELLNLTKDRLFRFCLYLAGDEESASDLLQESYVRVMVNTEKLPDAKGFMSWMLRVIKNLYIDGYRTRQHRYAYEREKKQSGLELVPEPGVERKISVRKILNKMDSQERMILLLVDLEGHSYEEAAEIIGISEPALRNRLSRIRKNFVKKFEKG